MKKIIEKLKCNHKYEFIRIVPDCMLSSTGGQELMYRCKECGNVKYKKGSD